MRKIIDKLYLVILLLALLLIIGGESLFEQPSKKTTTPTTTISPRTYPPVMYDEESNARMLQLVENRVPLSSSDRAAKEQLIKRPNPIHETATYKIEYISPLDEFLVEIKTMNINKAKEESVAWLLSQKVSKAGICHLPVVYYLNGYVAENLRNMNIRFNPLPPEC